MSIQRQQQGRAMLKRGATSWKHLSNACAHINTCSHTHVYGLFQATSKMYGHTGVPRSLVSTLLIEKLCAMHIPALDASNNFFFLPRRPGPRIVVCWPWHPIRGSRPTPRLFVVTGDWFHAYPGSALNPSPSNHPFMRLFAVPHVCSTVCLHFFSAA